MHTAFQLLCMVQMLYRAPSSYPARLSFLKKGNNLINRLMLVTVSVADIQNTAQLGLAMQTSTSFEPITNMLLILACKWLAEPKP